LLDLNELREGLYGISCDYGASLAEASGVCLESQNHTRGDTQLHVRGRVEKDHQLSWPQITSKSLTTWNDPEPATEQGAIGIAVLLARKEIGYEIIERARKGTGFDYWIGKTQPDSLFQDRARLEISGIRQGSESAINARIRQKLRQTDKSDNMSLPAFIIVVEFGKPIARIEEKNNEQNQGTAQ